MISAKNSTNPESFTEFGRGRRIDWRDPMDTPIYHNFTSKHLSELDSQLKEYQKN
jgi:hypothetical protein